MNVEEAQELLARGNGWCVIDVYCDDAAHKGGVYQGREALSFILDARKEPTQWGMYVESKLRQRGKGTRTRLLDGDVRAVVVDGKRINKRIDDVDESAAEAAGAHVTYRLYCKECTNKKKYGKGPVTVVDERVSAARLHAVLDEIALDPEGLPGVTRPNPGVLRIRLPDLAAKVRSG